MVYETSVKGITLVAIRGLLITFALAISVFAQQPFNKGEFEALSIAQ